MRSAVAATFMSYPWLQRVLRQASFLRHHRFSFKMPRSDPPNTIPVEGAPLKRVRSPVTPEECIRVYSLLIDPRHNETPMWLRFVLSSHAKRQALRKLTSMPTNLTIFAAQYLVFIDAAIAAGVIVYVLRRRPGMAAFDWLVA